MSLKKQDWAVLQGLKLVIKPVGVRYSVDPPEGIKELEGRLALCEMLKKAQEGEPFYINAGHHACEAGAYVLGLEDIHQQFISGTFGAGLGFFKDQRAATRIYNYIPTILKKVLNHVTFAPLDIDGEGSEEMEAPDVTIILADTWQTWILLRALSFETGQKWEGHFSPVAVCAWLFAWPFVHGRVNTFPTGLGFGMRRRNLFPEGLQFVAVPFDCWPNLLRVLKEMPWAPEPFLPGGMEFVDRLRKRLNLD